MSGSGSNVADDLRFYITHYAVLGMNIQQTEEILAHHHNIPQSQTHAAWWSILQENMDALRRYNMLPPRVQPHYTSTYQHQQQQPPPPAVPQYMGHGQQQQPVHRNMGHGYQQQPPPVPQYKGHGQHQQQQPPPVSHQSKGKGHAHQQPPPPVSHQSYKGMGHAHQQPQPPVSHQSKGKGHAHQQLPPKYPWTIP